MTTYFVTRHEATKRWAKNHFPDATIIESLDPEDVKAGDTVLGTLPVHLSSARVPT